MTQYLFADESGDCGFRHPNSSKAFLLAIVQLPNRAPIPQFVELRKKLHLQSDFEFHFVNLSKQQRTLFFDSIHSLCYSVRVGILDKTKINKHSHNISGVDFEIDIYTRLLLRTASSDIVDDILVLDNKPKVFRKALRVAVTRAYQQAERKRLFKKIVSGKSRNDDGLQLADMLVGAIRLAVFEDEPVYYNKINDKIVDFWLIK